MRLPALSVVAPAGDRIRSGKKTLEIRRWKPDELPLRDLVIVQNKVRLSHAGPKEDSDGEVVALVDVESVSEWREDQLKASCASNWEPGYLAWKLTNVRPLTDHQKAPAKLRIYEVNLLV